MNIRASVYHFVNRWRDILRDHDWELLAVFVSAISVTRGVVYLLPRRVMPEATLRLADAYSAYVPARAVAALFALAGLVTLAGVYKLNYRVIRLGLFHGFILWAFHGYLSVYEGLLPGAAYQIGAAVACGLMFVRARVEHPNGARAHAQPKP